MQQVLLLFSVADIWNGIDDQRQGRKDRLIYWSYKRRSYPVNSKSLSGP